MTAAHDWAMLGNCLKFVLVIGPEIDLDPVPMLSCLGLLKYPKPHWVAPNTVTSLGKTVNSFDHEQECPTLLVRSKSQMVYPLS